MGMSVTGGGAVKSEPNVVPMIDVMLVLLIIFMVVLPALTSGFTANPPQGINLKSHPEEDTDQVLGIDKQGNYYINKRPIPFDSIGPILQEVEAQRVAETSARNAFNIFRRADQKCRTKQDRLSNRFALLDVYAADHRGARRKAMGNRQARANGFPQEISLRLALCIDVCCELISRRKEIRLIELGRNAVIQSR